VMTKWALFAIVVSWAIGLVQGIVLARRGR
jgi:hypothetical protein